MTQKTGTAIVPQAIVGGLILLLVGMTMPEVSFAKIYKCQSSGGETEYRSLPCEQADQQTTVRTQESAGSKRTRKARRSKYASDRTSESAKAKRAAKARSKKTRRNSNNRGYTSNSFCAKVFKEISDSRKRGSIGVRRRDGSAEIHTGEQAAQTANEAERVFGGLCN